MSREDELLALILRARRDDEAFMTCLLELARRDVQEVLDEVRAAAFPSASERVAAYEALARLGRRFAASAALVADYEREHAPA